MSQSSTTSFFGGIFRHVKLGLSFRHDGSGLPGKPSAPFFILVALAVVFAVARHWAFGTFPTIGSVVRFSLVLLVLFSIFNATSYLLLSLYLCLSIGIDAIAVIGGLLLGPQLKSDFFFFGLSMWETVAFVAGLFRITHRSDHGG